MKCLPRRTLHRQAATVIAASLSTVLGSAPALAQVSTTIVPGATNTTVTETVPGQYDIQGGALSDGAAPNLFHHFLHFDLVAGDQAIFRVSDTAIENVIGLIEPSRLGEFDPARINGMLGLTGAEANLYLVSPGGIIMGAQAQLALPADFTATTADGLFFDDAELSVFQSGEAFDASTLTGTPTAYDFTALDPEGIENRGDLAVNQDQSITLLAGNIQNTGTLTAPSGNVNLLATPGGYTVRLSRPGTLLSLELTPNQANLPEFIPTPIDPSTWTTSALPEMLTGGSATQVGRIIQNPDGSFSLVGTAPPVTIDGPYFEEVGTVVLQGDVDVSDRIGGNISVIAPRIALIGADLNADGTATAGQIQIGSLPVDVRAGAPLNLDTVYMYGDRRAQLSASGLRPDSSAGLVYIWADDTVQYYGGATVAGEDGTLFIDAGLDLQRIVPRPRSR